MRGRRTMRCGSVITAIIGGRSVYGYVHHFFQNLCKNDMDMHDFVSWLPLPDYPFRGSPLIVRLRDVNPKPNAQDFMSLNDVDPSRIIISRSDVEQSLLVHVKNS